MLTKKERYDIDFKTIVDKIDTILRFDEVFEGETSISFSRTRQAPCPFCESGHSGQKGSDGAFTFYPGYNFGKCYSCGTKTNIIGLVKHENGFDYVQAIHHIAQKYFQTFLEKPEYKIDISAAKNVKPYKISERKKLSVEQLAEEKEKQQKTFKYLLDMLLKNDKSRAKKYLESRGIDTSVIPLNAFHQLNEYKDKPVGVVFLSSDQKFINKRNFDFENGAKQFAFGELLNSLYNFSFRKEQQTIFVTEGAINALSIYQTGKSAIALFATTNKINDVEKFKPYFENKDVVVAYDFDENFAGQKAAIELSHFIITNFKTKSVSILLHPQNKDDNDLLKDGELSQFLDNELNYIFHSEKELAKYLGKIKKDYKGFKPVFKQNNYYNRPVAIETEVDGYFEKITEKCPENIFDKLSFTEELSHASLTDCNFQFVKEFRIVRDKTVHVHISTEENPIFTIDDKIIIRPFAKRPYKKIEFYGDNDYKNWSYGEKQLEANFLDGRGETETENHTNKNDDGKVSRTTLVYNFIDFVNLYAIDENPIYIHENLYYDLKEKLLGFAFSIFQTPTNSSSDRYRAEKTALKNVEIKTYYLDDDTYSVSHFLQKRSSHFYKKHLNNALPLKFWEWDKKTKDFDLNIIILQNFLNKFGYYTFESIQDRNGYMYIQTKGKVVSKMDKDIFPRHIKKFTDNYLSNRGEGVKLRNKIVISNRFSEQNLSGLKQIQLDFENAGSNFQNWFFSDGNMWTVTKDEIKISSQSELKKYVWDEELLKYPSKIKKAPFIISYQDDYSETYNRIKSAKTQKEKQKYISKLGKFKAIEKYDLEITDRNNYFLQYLFATSYVYFEKAESKGYFVKPSDFWYEMPDELLSEDEIKEIKLHIINKITWLGYYMKDYREPADDFGLAILDAIDDLPVGRKRGAAGGGKSLITKGIKEIKRTLIIKAEREDFAEYPHRYEGYENEKVIVCDDMHLKSRIGNMLTDFSDGLYVNQKHKKVVAIPFSRSPKIIITRNYVDDEGERVDRRLGRMFVFPFFHDNKSGRFKQRRKPADYFGRMLYKDDTEEDKSNLVNFFAYAYMANRNYGEVNPPMADMEKFRISKRIGEPLIEFLDTYFENDENNFGYIDRVPFYKQFIEEQRFNMNSYQKTQMYNTSQKFKHLIGDYCKIKGYIFNPVELYTDSENKRIRQLSETQMNTAGNAKVTEHLYINTEQGTTEEIKNKANKIIAPATEISLNNIPFDEIKASGENLPF